jgi:hypothetical protein
MKFEGEVKDKAHVAKSHRLLSRHGDYGTPCDGAGNDLHRPGGALLIGVDQDPSAAIFNAIARHRAVYDIYYLAVRHLISLRGSYQTSNFTKSFSYIPLSTSIEVRCIDCLLLPLPRHRPSGPG